MIQEGLNSDKTMKIPDLKKSKPVLNMVHIINSSIELENFIRNHSDEIVVVKFYSKQCPHCREYKPIFEEFFQNYNTEFVFAKADVKNDILLSHKYKVTDIPTTLIFRNGVPCYKRIGIITPLDMKDKFEGLLNTK
jgi:thioredoxin 1